MVDSNGIKRVRDYEQFEHLLADTINRVALIDERTTAHTGMLNELVGLTGSIHSLNANTAANTAAIGTLNSTMQDVRSVMSRYQEADQEKWNVATGKRHVPLLTHYAVVATLCGVILGGFFAWMRVDLVTKHFELRNKVEGKIAAVEREIKTLEEKTP